MPKDFARHTRANNDAKAKRSGAQKRTPSKRSVNNKHRTRVSPTSRTLFHGPSICFGALLGAGVVIAAAYAPELLQQATVTPGQQSSQPEQTPAVEFDFPNLLRNSEIKADPKPYAVPERSAPQTPTSFNLQAASFRERVDADQLRAQLLLQNLPAKVSERTVGSSTWHRVTVGPFPRRVEAERALTKLREQGLDGIFLAQ